MVTGSQNQGMLSQPGPIRMILLHGESYNFSTTLSKMVGGGKAYASRSSHGRLIASTAVVRGIWCRRYKGNLLLSLWPIGLFEANATCCIYCLEDLLKERPPFRWSGLAQIACLSATTLSRPGMCRALGVT